MIIMWLYRRLRELWQRGQVARGSSVQRVAASEPPIAAVTEPSGPSPAARGPLALVVHQVRYDLLASFRNPRARFFTFFFPILLLVVFSSVFGHSGHTFVDGTRVSLSRYFVGGILTLSIVTAAYASLVITIATVRESGVLKRRRATPAPAALLIAGQAISTLVIAIGMSAVLLIVARIAYGVSMPVGSLAAMAVAVVVGTLAFACIGYAVAGMIGSPDSAQPIVQATLLPLYFISGVWIPFASLGHTLRSIASLFPIEHLANLLHLASAKTTFSAASAPADLLVLAAWAVAAGLFAVRRFSWLPSTATA